LGIGPNPQSPIPNPQSPIVIKIFIIYNLIIIIFINNYYKLLKLQILLFILFTYLYDFQIYINKNKIYSFNKI